MERTPDYEIIRPQELKRRLDTGDRPALLDVREPWEFELTRYATDPAPDYEKFSDPAGTDKDRATLVEIRSGGQHTVVPPSVHPSGEVIAWEQDGEPAHLGGDELRAAVNTLAAAALLVRHWNYAGKRNDQALALLGGLISGGLGRGKGCRLRGDRRPGRRGRGVVR